MEEELRIYLRAEGVIAKRFSQIKEHLGLKNDTEVIRSLINWYYREHEEDLQPKLKHFKKGGKPSTSRKRERGADCT